MGGVDIILRIITYILGIILMSISLSFLVMYSNLFALGYDLWAYICYITTKVECLIGILGIILVSSSFKKGN